jgi:hypothetical protein
VNSLLKKIRRFNRKHNEIRVILELFGVVLLWWAIWGILDTYLLHTYPLFSYIAGGVIGLAILYIEDFKLSQ